MVKRNTVRISKGRGVRPNGHVSGAKLRPRERVLHHLQTEFDRPDIKQGTRLPTVRELSSRLGVSVYTVQQAFATLAKEGRVRTEVGNGTFLMSTSDRKTEVFRLGLNLHLEKGVPPDDWSYRIGGGIFHASMHAPKNIILVPVSKQLEQSPDLNQRLLDNVTHVDGLILFPFPGAEVVKEGYERAGKLVVHLNPPTVGATSNFVSSDFFGASVQVGEAWRLTGRRRVVLLTSPLKNWASHQLRMAGLVTGLDCELGRSIEFRKCEAEWWKEEDGYRAMQGILSDKHWMPDAIYCGGDFLALGAIRALQEAGLKVPDDVSVVGGTGLVLAHSHCPHLTRTNQPCEKLGEELVAMMCERIAQNGASLPGRFFPTPFVGGATTRPKENEILRVCRSQ